MEQNNSLTKKGRKLILGFPYSKDRVEESKKLGASKYDPTTKTRSYSFHSAPQLVAFCEKHNIPIDPEAYDIAKEAESYPEIEMHNGGLRVRVSADEFPEEILNTKSGDWILVPSMYAKATVTWGKKHNKRIDQTVLDYAKTQFQNETRNYALGTALEAEEHPITGLKSTPIPEQWVPVQAAILNNKFLLADEQGLGKTLESLMVARIEGQERERVIIVCPDRLAENWIVEMGIHFEEGTFTPWIATSQKPKPIPEGTDVIVIGWSILGYWKDPLVKWKPDMVIADEGHYAKSGKVVTKKEEVIEEDDNGNIAVKEITKKVSGSQRSGSIISLLNSLKENDKAMVLTGTPIPNRPNELLAILQALNIDGFFGGSFLYKMRYCDGKQKYIGRGKGIRGEGYIWDFSGASNLLELNSRLLASGHYVRRTKKHLVEAGRLPKKIVDGVEFYDNTQTPLPTMIKGDPDIMKEYAELELGLSEDLADRARAYAQEKRLGINNAKVLKKIAAEGQKEKESIFKLRKLAGLAAVPKVTELVQTYLDKGEKVILIAHHREVVDAYENAFPGSVKIQGAMPAKKIEENKALFNAEGFDHPVLVLALEAGKTGHTLCKQPDKKCAISIFAEQAWNPADAHQAQDRIWRLGQDREVNILNIIAEGTVNEDIYHKRAIKRRIVDEAVDSITPDSSATESDDRAVAGAIAVDLAKRGLAKG